MSSAEFPFQFQHLLLHTMPFGIPWIAWIKYAAYQKMTEGAARKHNYFNYKRLICEQLVMPHHDSSQQQRAVVQVTV